MSRDWRMYVGDMRAGCDRITSDATGISREDSLRNILIHGYFGIDP